MVTWYKNLFFDLIPRNLCLHLPKTQNWYFYYLASCITMPKSVSFDGYLFENNGQMKTRGDLMFWMVFNRFLVSRKRIGGSRGVVVSVLDSDIEVIEFELQSRYYTHFRTNALGKLLNSLITQVWIKCPSTNMVCLIAYQPTWVI